MVVRRRPTPSTARHATEAELASTWENRRFPRSGLATTSGVDVVVTDPGQRNTDSGPDFIDAVLRFGAGPFERGPVELHRRPSDWRAHGHDGDAAYSAILLHVVAESRGLTELAGRPLLELPAARRRGGAPPTPVRASRRELELQGDARFDGAAARIEGDIAAVGPEQALYEGLLGALGYAKNEDGFRELARIAPFAFLHWHASNARTAAERDRRLGGLLFGAAGLLPSLDASAGGGAPDRETSGLEDSWSRFGDGRSLPPGTWRTFRVRPDNTPVRRVAAAVRLASGWLERDLTERLAAAAAQGEARRAARAVAAELVIEARGYWATRRRFGTKRAGARPAALVGWGRAREMAANVVLPFLAALGDWRGDGALEEAARAAYRAMPAPPDNAVAAWAMPRALSRAGAPRLTARQQQGLLHLAKERL